MNNQKRQLLDDIAKRLFENVNSKAIDELFSHQNIGELVFYSENLHPRINFSQLFLDIKNFDLKNNIKNTNNQTDIDYIKSKVKILRRRAKLEKLNLNLID